jgi:hypothetical protein
LLLTRASARTELKKRPDSSRRLAGDSILGANNWYALHYYRQALAGKPDLRGVRASLAVLYRRRAIQVGRRQEKERRFRHPPARRMLPSVST